MISGQQIIKYAPRKFYLNWQGVLNGELRIDFSPLIERHNLTGNFVLLHWQARPKYYRTWGVYDGRNDNYQSVKAENLMFQATQKMSCIDIPERVALAVPTAVICFYDSVLTTTDDITVISSGTATAST